MELESDTSVIDVSVSSLVGVGEFDPCMHCRIHPGNCPRGLCRSCYDNHEIRTQYPRISKYAKLGVAHHSPIDLSNYGPPTNIPPGPEKVEVLAERADKGLPLWHPLDAKGTEEVPTYQYSILSG